MALSFSPLAVDDEIVLRCVEVGDAETLFALTASNRSYLRQWLPWVDKTRSLEDTLTFLKSDGMLRSTNSGCSFAILQRGRICGLISYYGIDWTNRCVSIGYWLEQGKQGNGIITRACRALVTRAFREMGLNRVEIRCAVENVRSQAIPERLGFQFEGVIRQGEWLNDRFVDLKVYGMIAQEWRDEPARGR